MKLKDYGESVKLELCNLFYQKLEEKEFDTLHEAWVWAKPKADKYFIKIFLKRDNDPKKTCLLRITKNYKTNEWVIQGDWDISRKTSSLDEVYDLMGNIVINKESY